MAFLSAAVSFLFSSVAKTIGVFYSAIIIVGNFTTSASSRNMASLEV